MRLSQLQANSKPAEQSVDKDMVDRLVCTASFICFALHTNDFVETNSKGSYENFGLYTLCSPESFKFRIVGLGWTVGKDSKNTTTKSFVLKHSGVTVSEKAGNYHGIDNERVETDGANPCEVLKEFWEDAHHVVSQGGRLVAHHLG